MMMADTTHREAPRASDGAFGFVDVTLRDAHQCLWSTRMTTAMMTPIVASIDRSMARLKRLVTASGIASILSVLPSGRASTFFSNSLICCVRRSWADGARILTRSLWVPAFRRDDTGTGTN